MPTNKALVKQSFLSRMRATLAQIKEKKDAYELYCKTFVDKIEILNNLIDDIKRLYSMKKIKKINKYHNNFDEIVVCVKHNNHEFAKKHLEVIFHKLKEFSLFIWKDERNYFLSGENFNLLLSIIKAFISSIVFNFWHNFDEYSSLFLDFLFEDFTKNENKNKENNL